jgi:hypothetical protein
MAIFKILKGFHEQREGTKLVRYHADGKGAGAFIMTQHDLQKMFPNKFERVESLPESATPKQSKRDAYDAIAEAQAAEAREQAAKKTPSSDSTSDTPASSDAPDLDFGDEDEEVDWGENITDEFRLAVDKGVLVYKDGRVYNVFASEASVEPLNAAPLTSKDKVKKFLEQR